MSVRVALQLFIFLLISQVFLSKLRHCVLMFLFKKHEIIYRCSKDFVEITIHSRNTTYSCGNLDTKICISLKSRPNLWVDNLILFMFAVLRATRHNRNRPRKTKKSTFLKICLENHVWAFACFLLHQGKIHNPNRKYIFTSVKKIHRFYLNSWNLWKINYHTLIGQSNQ